jgi:hypothetical protein
MTLLRRAELFWYSSPNGRLVHTTVGSYEGISQAMGRVPGRVSRGVPAMQPSFAAVREQYLEELIEHEWYDVRTFGKKQRQEMTAPEYLVELLQHGHVTAVEMHSHTPRSDGLIEPERIGAWTHALYKKGYFRDGHLAVPLVVMVTDHDYIYASSDLQAIAYDVFALH